MRQGDVSLGRTYLPEAFVERAAAKSLAKVLKPVSVSAQSEMSTLTPSTSTSRSGRTRPFPCRASIDACSTWAIEAKPLV